MPAGEPGGPDSEVFYEFDFVEHDTKYGEHCHPNCDCGRFMEIGNSVFMEYVKTETGFEKLPKQNVDFGGGLERIAAAKLNNPDIFKISLLGRLLKNWKRFPARTYDSHTESMRVIADHLRAATFLAVDGVCRATKSRAMSCAACSAGLSASRLTSASSRTSWSKSCRSSPIFTMNDFPKSPKTATKSLKSS